MNRERVLERQASGTDAPAGRRQQAGPQRDVPWNQTHLAAVLMCTGTLVLKSLVFEPIGLWPLTLVCLVPWLLFVGGSSTARRVYAYSFLFALAFFLINMRWLSFATGGGYVALSVYQALYFPVVAIAIRHVVRRRHWPLAAALPVVWVGMEIIRAVFLTGFPWFFLSHGLYKVLSLIQISALVGAYGVSFLAAGVNGLIADAAFARWTAYPGATAGARTSSTAQAVAPTIGAGPRIVRVSAMCLAALWLAAIIYGQVELRRDTLSEGPKIAVIQGDFISTIHPDRARDHDRATDEEKERIYFSMMEAASAQRPDLYLLPETPWTMYLNPQARHFFAAARRSFNALQLHARRHNGVVVTGSASLVPTPHDLLTKDRRYNSATVFTPDGNEPQRYDKVHLVPFGEYVPFRFGRLRFLYFWLNWLTPFSGPDGTEEFSLFPGESFKRFTMQAPSQGRREYRFAVPICYEDVMPYVSRVFVAGGADRKQVDFLLNISNDGWFGRGTQQPQHLAVCTFRAVENRVGIARAVNTGLSGFIQPTGRIHDLVSGDPATPWPGACGYRVARVGVDSRFTLYSRYGDWFAWACAALWLLVFLDYWIARARGRRGTDLPVGRRRAESGRGVYGRRPGRGMGVRHLITVLRLRPFA